MTKKTIEKKLREAERIVTEVLEQYPITRDDDRLLTWLTWRKQFERIDRYSIDMLRNAFLGGMLLSPDTITRARRKIQETRQDLRGFRTGQRGDLETIYRHYYGDTKVIQQDLFSGRFKDMAIATNMYEEIVGKGEI